MREELIHRPYARTAGGPRAMSVLEALEHAGAEFAHPAYGEQAALRCPTPGHEDRNPSASVNTRTGLWMCHGCGARGNLFQLLDLLVGIAKAAALDARVRLDSGGGGATVRRDDDAAGWPPDGPFEPSPTVAREYVYEIEAGEEYYTVRRNPSGTASKFTCSRPKPDAYDGRAYNLGPRERRILYGIPELKAAGPSETIFVTEGEKDAEAIRSAGGVATTNQGGVNGWATAWANGGRDLLAGRQVVIVADRDHGPGIRAALQRREDIAPHAASCRIVGARVGKDAADHLHNGCSLDEFVAYEPAVSRQTPGALTADGSERGTGDDLVWHSGASIPEIPRLEWIAYPFALRGGSATHFIGRPKVAKTTYLLALTEAVTRGRDFLGETTARMPVVYLSEQASLTFLHQLHPGLLNNPDFHFALKPDNPGFGWEDFVRLGVQKCEQVGSELLIFDTVGKFARLAAESEYSASQVRKTLDALDLAKRSGVSYVLAIHTNKKGGNSEEVVGSSSGSHAWDAEADLLLKVTRKTGEHRGRLFNEGRVQEAISSWTIEYDPLTRDVALVADGDELGPGPPAPRSDRAEELISELLGDGPIPAAELNDAVAAEGLSRGVLAQAKRRLGVTHARVNGQHTVGYADDLAALDDAQET